MNDRALELGHVLPLRRIALGVAVIALAHPEEIRGEANRLAGVGSRGFDGPEIFLARPFGRGDGVLIADVAGEIVFLDHLAHVFQDFGGARDRRAGPWLEAVAEGMEVAVGADAGITVGAPGAAERLLRFERDESRSRALRREMIGRADAGDAGARDQHVEMLGRARRGFANLALNVHRTDLFVVAVRIWDRRARTVSSDAAGSELHFASAEERQPLEQMHVLLVLEQRAMQRRDQLARIAFPEHFRRDVLVQAAA